nr:hypothetical protein Iba_chr11aCG12270 [Ipomoea batatas]
METRTAIPMAMAALHQSGSQILCPVNLVFEAPTDSGVPHVVNDRPTLDVSLRDSLPGPYTSYHVLC